MPSLRDARAQLRENGRSLVGATVRLLGRGALWRVVADSGDSFNVVDASGVQHVRVAATEIDYVATLPREYRWVKEPDNEAGDHHKLERFATPDGGLLEIGDWVEAGPGAYLNGYGGLAVVERFEVSGNPVLVAVKGARRADTHLVPVNQVRKVFAGAVVTESRQKSGQQRQPRRANGQTEERLRCPVCRRGLKMSQPERICSPHRVPFVKAIPCPMSGRRFGVLPRQELQVLQEIATETSSSVFAFGGGLPTLGRRRR